jgi:hypothetical protein
MHLPHPAVYQSSPDIEEVENNLQTSIERSNKRKKFDCKLESGQYQSIKIWYSRTYGIYLSAFKYLVLSSEGEYQIPNFFSNSLIFLF